MAVSEYDSMASYYDRILEPILWKMRRKIIKVSNVTEGMKVLEVACGTGTQAIRFKKAGAQYTGIDLSLAMLNIAGKRNLECLHADGTKLPLEDNSFDLSTITLALHEVDPEISKKIVLEMLRVTRGEGSLVIVDYTIPKKNTIYSGLGYKSVHYVEKLVGGSHFRNYKKFMNAGGLVAFLETFRLEIIETSLIFGGNIGIIKVQRNLSSPLDV
ncbi:MAG: methyltransferase domain-containing protein [Spirochaetia bacterium]|jgi:ubiquinone/menaquinone biosynthesis C-methylase UbiE|nr:methyltransferase domain-containing protein [Spirochaetia bacterium]